MHPLTPDLSGLNDQDLSSKLSELQTKMNTAYRMGNAGLIHQIQMVIEDYQSELNNRQRKQLDELLKKNNKFDNIIDIK